MSKPKRARFVVLDDLLVRRRPDIDPRAIAEGRVLVDGRFLTNPAAQVRLDARLQVLPRRRLRGDIKLSHALDRLGVGVADRVAVDYGASAGGFTTALLDRGARRIYAVDAGVGQLVGRLRSDPRVVNLEGHNLGALSRHLVPDVVDVITADLSYLSLAKAVPQFGRIEVSPHADLVALVKPTFELGRRHLAATDADVEAALRCAAEGLEACRWTVVASCPAPATGRAGAREVFIRAARSGVADYRRIRGEDVLRPGEPGVPDRA